LRNKTSKWRRNEIEAGNKGNSMEKDREKINSIEYINVRVFAHATEDQEKVEVATKNLFPEALCDELVFKKTVLIGHYSNPIILLETQLKNRKLLPDALLKLGAELSAIDKEQLHQDLQLHLDKGNFYLRFDKQAAYMGILKLSQNDPIHIKIHFKGKSSREIEQLAKQAGLLP
jgi:RNA binding exosome subunit